MKNRRIKLVLIIGFIYLFLLVGVNVVKELNNTKKFSPSSNTTITNETSLNTKEIDTKTDDVIPDEGEVFEEENPGEINPENHEQPTEGTTEGTTPGTTKGTTKGTTTTKKTTTTTKASIPSKISCSNRQIVSLSREEVLAKIGHPYTSNTCIKWSGFRKGSKDTFDGTIPTEWLGDPVYVSMATPAESLSEYMIGANRDNAHDLGIQGEKLLKMQVPIGAIYLTKDGSLPDSYTLNYGKIKLFCYSKSKKNWITINSEPHPKMVMQYQLPWTAHLPTTDFTNKFVDHGSYVSIDYKTGDIDSTHIMHYWGTLTSYDKNDCAYYASAYEVWTSTPAVVGNLTATSGIDTKDKSGASGYQLYSSYGMKVTTSKKVLWGHTIPMSEYDYYRDGVQLQNLFNAS